MVNLPKSIQIKIHGLAASDKGAPVAVHGASEGAEAQAAVEIVGLGDGVENDLGGTHMVPGDSTDHLDEVAEQVVAQAPVVAWAIAQALVVHIHGEVNHLDGGHQGGELLLLRQEDGGAGDGQGRQELLVVLVDDEIGD